jgi:stage V sporulation protein G
MNDPQDRLLAFCSLTFDSCFVIRDLKIIRGAKGPFIAMPSRKLMDRCPRCGGKNTLRSAFCNHCGRKQPEARAIRGPDGRAKLYADIAHPINSECRDSIQSRVIEAYEREVVLSQEPGYISHYDDYGDDYDLGDAGFYDDPGLDHHRPAPAKPSSRPGSTVRLDPAEDLPLASPHDAPPHESARNGGRSPRSEADNFGDGVL